MQNINSKLESAKSIIPTLFNSSRDKVGGVISLVTTSEADYFGKTENTDKDIINLLKSKMEMEVILGLKFIIAVITN